MDNFFAPTYIPGVGIYHPLEEDIKEVDVEETTTRISHHKLYSLPEHSLKKGNKTVTDTKSQNYTDEQRSFQMEKDNEVLIFHGVILRSQLVEMLKYKIFFEEKDGVSLT